MAYSSTLAFQKFHLQKEFGFMIRLNPHSILISVAIAIGLTGCTTIEQPEVIVEEATFSTFYNDITGELSDGTTVSGKSWLTIGNTRGNFCLRAGDLVCSGKYSANISRRISGSFSCSDGTTGEYITKRLPKGDFLIPLDATATLSDGRSGTATFSPFKQGSSSTTCVTP